jgi:hypothetical protein
MRQRFQMLNIDKENRRTISQRIMEYQKELKSIKDFRDTLF